MRSGMNVKANQQGFTLIELVVVIVILGILAVTAAPKFINLQDDAQTATLQGVQAAMGSASALVHSKSLIKGNENTAAAANVDVTVDSAGTKVLIGYGYPVNTDTEWQKLLDVETTDFTYDSTSVTGVLIIYPSGKAPTDITKWTKGSEVPTSDASCFTFYIIPAAKYGVPQTGTVSCQVPA
jgi:MSHA pilin protein MshA